MIGRADENATGYRPAVGTSLRGFLLTILGLAAILLVSEELGPTNANAIFQLAVSALVIGFSIREILHPLRDRDGATAREHRNARLGSIALLIFFTALGTSAVTHLLGSE